MRLFIYTILISSVFLAACENLTNPDGDINISPNSPTSTGYQNILSTAEVGTILTQTGMTSRVAGLFGGTHTGINRQYGIYNSYLMTTTDFDPIWDDLFIYSFRNAKLTETRAAEQGVEGITKGITQVLQALAAGTGASLYGSIPFDELADDEFTNPNFEQQLQVYEKVQLLLDDAIINLESGGGRPAVGSDIFFDGSPAKWVEVAHSLKARYYMHTKNYTEAYNEAQLGISTFENSLYAPHGDALGNANLNYQLFEIESQKTDIVISDFMISLINADSTESPNIDNYRGNSKTNEAARYEYLFQFVDGIGFHPNTNSGQFAGQNTSAPIITYQENLLILAEAGFRTQGFNTGLSNLNSFRTFMNSGGYLGDPQLSMVQYDQLIATDFDNGGIENQDGVSRDEALLREILQERYITLFGTIELFNDVRRTVNESLVRVPVMPNRGNVIPARFLYAQSELNRNTNAPTNVPDLFEKTEVNK